MSLSLFNQLTPRTAAAVYYTAVDMYSLSNIWAEQSVCTSLNKNAVTHSNLLRFRFKNISAACIMCTIEQGGIKLWTSCQPNFKTIISPETVGHAKQVNKQMKE